MFKLLTERQIREKDTDTLKRIIRSKLGGYRVAINNIPAGLRFFRGVLCESRPTTIDRISYPPSEKVTKLGRVNRLHTPMFYCSAAAPSVFYELRAKKGDYVALSSWEVTEPLWLHHLGYHEHSLRRMGVVNTAIRSKLVNPIPNETRENAIIRRTLSLAFTEEVRDGQEYKYKQSIAINELLFDKASPLPIYHDGPRSSRAAGTEYPAMQMKGAADNVAIWPEFVESSLCIKSVGYAVVEAADDTNSSYTILTLAMSYEFNGREIVWPTTVPSETERRRQISFENGEWVMRDGLGQIYDRH